MGGDRRRRLEQKTGRQRRLDILRMAYLRAWARVSKLRAERIAEMLGQGFDEGACKMDSRVMALGEALGALDDEFRAETLEAEALELTRRRKALNKVADEA